MSAFAHDTEFQKLRSGAEVDLPSLMLEFAGDAYPDLDRAACLDEISRLGENAAALSREDSLQHLSEISRLLYDEEQFSGNRAHYDDPRNSYLNEVLDRRTGIPISLGLLYQAVAWRAGVMVYGVATPGHFVLRYDGAATPVYLDPFCRGDLLDQDACRRRIEQLSGHVGWPDSCFRPATSQEIAARALRNLKVAYARLEAWDAALPVQRRLAALLPDMPDERRDLGLILLRNGHAGAALEHLRSYAQQGAEQARSIRPFLGVAQRMAAELN